MRTEIETRGTGRRAGLDRDEVIQRALELVETRGPDALTMRALASELGVTTTTIYWHVGGRDELLTAIVERLSHIQAQQPIAGESPRDRIGSIAEQIWSNALEHRHVTSLAHRTGTTNLLEKPMKLAILRELESAGVRGEEARAALQAVILCIAGFLVVAFREGAGERARQTGTTAESWIAEADGNGETMGISAATLKAMTRPSDLHSTFSRTIAAVICEYVPDHDAGDGNQHPRPGDPAPRGEQAPTPTRRDSEENR